MIQKEVSATSQRVVAAAYSWLKRLFRSAPTEEEQRQTDKARQREIRRELRGLPPEESSTKRS